MGNFYRHLAIFSGHTVCCLEQKSRHFMWLIIEFIWRKTTWLSIVIIPSIFIGLFDVKSFDFPFRILCRSMSLISMTRGIQKVRHSWGWFFKVTFTIIQNCFWNLLVFNREMEYIRVLIIYRNSWSRVSLAHLTTFTMFWFLISKLHLNTL